jgi:hypothetical protein
VNRKKNIGRQINADEHGSERILKAVNRKSVCQNDLRERVDGSSKIENRSTRPAVAAILEAGGISALPAYS